MAFEGWNDAGDAASGALEHLISQTSATELAQLDPEPYYDFQVARPTIRVNESGIEGIRWPGATVHRGRTEGSPRDLVLVHGVEPSMRWPSFAAELTDMCEEIGAEMVVLLGALLADVPHTRALPVNVVAGDATLRDRLQLEPTAYEGPSGIVGVLQDAVARRGIPVVSLWSAVPYYVAQPPCPKGSISLLLRLDEVAGVRVPMGDLPRASHEWESTVADLVAEDPEVAELVERMESESTSPLAPASGDAIAREFERYLRWQRTDTDPESDTNDDPDSDSDEGEND
jgi:hypothetical protein